MKIIPLDATRDLFQVLAIIGGFIIVWITLKSKGLTNAQRAALYLVGIATILADSWFLWRT